MTTKTIAFRIGQFEYMDENMNYVGGFIRIRVDLNIIEQICAWIFLLLEDRKVWVPLKYEVLPTYCYNCAVMDFLQNHGFLAVLKWKMIDGVNKIRQEKSTNYKNEKLNREVWWKTQIKRFSNLSLIGRVPSTKDDLVRERKRFIFSTIREYASGEVEEDGPSTLDRLVGTEPVATGGTTPPQVDVGATEDIEILSTAIVT